MPSACDALTGGELKHILNPCVYHTSNSQLYIALSVQSSHHFAFVIRLYSSFTHGIARSCIVIYSLFQSALSLTLWLKHC